MGSGHQQAIFTIDISEKDFIAYYTGIVKNIVVRSEDGRTVQFPANLLQQFVGRTGVKGRFRICYGENNKLLSISRIG